MKVMLVFPTVEAAPKGSPKPPLGIAYIAAYLEREGHEVKLVDTYARGMSSDELVAEIEKFKPELVGFSVLTIYMNSVGRYSEKIKEKFPETKIFVGHVHPSALPVRTLEDYSGIDFVVIGEGEETTAELAKALENKGDINNVNGIAYRAGDEIKLTAPRKRIENLDDLPFPAWHLLDMELYLTGLSSKRTFGIITTRGCPAMCTYCDQDAIWHRVIRIRSPENVVEEIKQLKQKYNMESFIIQDDTFTINKERIHRFCDLLEKENLVMPWEAKGRVNLVDLPLLKHMKKAGCGLIIYGIESGSQKILNDIKKGITLEMARQAVKWTKQAGIAVGTFWMMGFPNETEEDVKKTFELAKELDSDFTSSIAILVPFPSTPIYRELKENNLLLNEDWDSYWKIFELDKPQPPAIRTKYLTAEQLVELKKKYETKLAMIKRKKFLKKQIKRLPRIFLNFLKDPVHFTQRFKKTINGQLIIKKPKYS